MLPRLALPLAAIVLLTSACAAAPADDDALEFRDTYTCGTCPPNSPRTNDFRLPELRRSGLPNAEGLYAVGLRDTNGTLYAFDAVDDEFVARDTNGANVASGGDLVGWDLVVSDGVNTIDIHIRAHDAEIDSKADNGDPISAYALAFDTDEVPVETLNLCPDFRDEPDRPTVTLIVGERYDPEGKLVIANQPDWVTLACEDEALFKMKHLNYGPNDDFDGLGAPATVAQRQATIKMITADYCGSGYSFTAQGTHVHWENHSRHVAAVGLPDDAKFEAAWTADGALCLGTPRLVEVADVELMCELPPCDAPSYPGAEWYTWDGE
ncbi:ADYC domain-containing protein [Nannocystis radixulma]|uniref:ADYC domain-containing protein n=1 Tax=Nannocystis radixulma TaxID=2995305 RepID=A0ABT5BMU3_9BACT|nr:ADYC domain-containing protein [Nannocystis radixulma]MDC0675496.1 ADYC domain-containing protein [Nannocystis radixulma]